MPKKSTAAHKAQAARRSQAAARSQHVALVRTSGATGVETASAAPDTSVTSAPKSSASAVSTPRTAPSAPKSAGRTATVTRPATTNTNAKPGAKAAAPSQNTHASREQERRVARAKEMRRIREANMVTAEHYRYVLHDLRLTGILAALMFTVIIVLHFVLS
jgi:hypothetical protein